jgi:hypothetical protein
MLVVCKHKLTIILRGALRQRLIYTGKVLKDEETLANYKLQDKRELLVYATTEDSSAHRNY